MKQNSVSVKKINIYNLRHCSGWNSAKIMFIFSKFSQKNINSYESYHVCVGSPDEGPREASSQRPEKEALT